MAGCSGMRSRIPSGSESGGRAGHRAETVCHLPGEWNGTAELLNATMLNGMRCDVVWCEMFPIVCVVS